MAGSTEPVQNVPGGTSPGAATPADVASAIKGGDGADMVLVPAGEFWMGSTAAEIDRACKQGGGIGCEGRARQEGYLELGNYLARAKNDPMRPAFLCAASSAHFETRE
jgi:hypothetical protein